MPTMTMTPERGSPELASPKSSPSASSSAAAGRGQPGLDRATWTELVARLRGFVRRRVADPDDADDVLGEVLLRVHAGQPSLADRDRLLPWVFQVTRNAIVDHHRAAGRRRERATDNVPEPVVESVDEPGTAAFREELSRCLAPLLDRLDAPYREALRLVEEHGLTQAEAASRVGISVSGMKSRVQRGRHQVFAELDRCCELALDGRGAPIAWRKRVGTPWISGPGQASPSAGG